MIRRCFFVVTAFVIGSCVSIANGDLILELNGTVGNNVVSYRASGSIAVTQGTFNGGMCTNTRAPVGGNWVTGFDNDLGDILNDRMDFTLNQDLVLSNGGVSYRINNEEFAILDEIDLDGSSIPGRDDIELDPTAVITYPAIQAGDVVSWIGSGTFVLEDDETFDTLFIATGGFSNPIDGGNYTVRVGYSAVPEPSSVFLLAGGLSGYFFYRRRTSRSQKVVSRQDSRN